MINGSCKEQGSGADVVVHKPEGVEIYYALKFEFKATNNQTEYKAFIISLKLAHALWAESIKVRIYSQLVSNQFNEMMELYLNKAKQMIGMLKKVKIEKISRT